jgi:hypothetical protein
MSDCLQAFLLSDAIEELQEWLAIDHSGRSRRVIVGTRAATKNRNLPLATPTDIGSNATKDIAAALTALLPDVFTFYLKTKNFHCRFRSRIFATSTCCSTSRVGRYLR